MFTKHPVRTRGRGYMKKILVFRSAKHYIVKDCINTIRKIEHDSGIWLCIQEECVDLYKEEQVNMIIFPNGFFDYNTTYNNRKLMSKLQDTSFDLVYCPYSSPNKTVTPHSSEIEKITKNILKLQDMYYYNRYGDIQKRHLSSWNFDIIKKGIAKIKDTLEFTLLRIIYVVVSMRR